MPITRINETNYYYELHGAGVPMVLINGLKADHTGWMPVLSMLSKNNTVLIFDNLGVGRTTDAGEGFDIAKMADDTIALSRHLKLENPHIVGHSMGGAVAQCIAQRYPGVVKTLALCNTFTKFNDDSKQVFSRVLEMYQSGSSQADIMSAILPHVFSADFLTPELEKIIRQFSNEDPHAQTAQDYARQLHALYAFNANSWLHTIETPTLVISAKHDTVALPAQSNEIANKLKNATLVELNTGHASQVEKPTEFAEALLAFQKGYL